MEMNPPEKMNPTRSNIAAGMIMKLKEECGLYQRAINEVINITGFVCDHEIDQARSAITEIGKNHGLNPN